MYLCRLRSGRDLCLLLSYDRTRSAVVATQAMQLGWSRRADHYVVADSLRGQGRTPPQRLIGCCTVGESAPTDCLRMPR
eukprot:809898-Alexandrium_andersonii.AAC.1